MKAFLYNLDLLSGYNGIINDKELNISDQNYATIKIGSDVNSYLGNLGNVLDQFLRDQIVFYKIKGINARHNNTN